MLADLFSHLFTGLVGRMLEAAGSGFNDVLEYFFLWTGNFQGGPRCLAGLLATHVDAPGCRVTDSAALQSFYHLTAAMTDVLLVGALTYALGRGIWERSFQARHTLKSVLPGVLLVVVLVHSGLFLMQGAIDFNNAAVTDIWRWNAGVDLYHSNLWALLVPPPPENLVLAVLVWLVALLLVILAVTSVARNLLLVLLIGAAPLAFLCMLLPETKSYALSWRRLFFATVFAQVVQVAVLRLALILTFEQQGFLSAIHGLVALYLVLRVPTALHAASKAESKVISLAKQAEHTLERTIARSSGGRVRAHPAAD